MNYYVPYFNMYPNMITPTLNSASSGGLFAKLLGRNLNWSSILNNTQKTLGIVNQAIPMVRQVSPIVKNAKTMFKVMNEFKREDSSNIIEKTTTKINNTEVLKEKEPILNNGPTFFVN